MLYVGGQYQEMGLEETYMNAPRNNKGMTANQDLGTTDVANQDLVTTGISVLGWQWGISYYCQQTTLQIQLLTWSPKVCFTVDKCTILQEID